jgi:hypothetical protein
MVHVGPNQIPAARQHRPRDTGPLAPPPWRPQVCRGTAVTLVAPTAGMEEIANPFLQAAEDGS